VSSCRQTHVNTLNYVIITNYYQGRRVSVRVNANTYDHIELRD